MKSLPAMIHHVGAANEYRDDAKWWNAIKRDGYP